MLSNKKYNKLVEELQKLEIDFDCARTGSLYLDIYPNERFKKLFEEQIGNMDFSENVTLKISDHMLVDNLHPQSRKRKRIVKVNTEEIKNMDLIFDYNEYRFSEIEKYEFEYYGSGNRPSPDL